MDPRQKYSQFIPTVPCHEGFRSIQELTQLLRDQPNALVAYLMSVRVVDLLEKVHVDQHERESTLPLLRLVPFSVQRRIEGSAVAYTCQCVHKHQAG